MNVSFVEVLALLPAALASLGIHVGIASINQAAILGGFPPLFQDEDQPVVCKYNVNEQLWTKNDMAKILEVMPDCTYKVMMQGGRDHMQTKILAENELYNEQDWLLRARTQVSDVMNVVGHSPKRLIDPSLYVAAGKAIPKLRGGAGNCLNNHTAGIPIDPIDLNTIPLNKIIRVPVSWAQDENLVQKPTPDTDYQCFNQTSLLDWLQTSMKNPLTNQNFTAEQAHEIFKQIKGKRYTLANGYVSPFSSYAPQAEGENPFPRGLFSAMYPFSAEYYGF